MEPKLYFEAGGLAYKIYSNLAVFGFDKTLLDKISRLKNLLYDLASSKITDKENRMPQYIADFISGTLSTYYNRLPKQARKDLQKLNSMFNKYPYDNLYEILPQSPFTSDYSEQMEFFHTYELF